MSKTTRLTSLACFLFFTSVSSESLPNTDIHLLGPGIDTPYITFPSRYFFLLHRVPVESVQIRSIQLEPKSQSTPCLLWTQSFTQTRFCLLLTAESLHKRPLSLSELLAESPFCDDEESSHQNRYNLSIVRYKLYNQNSCKAPLEVIIKGPNGQPIHQQRLHLPNDTLLSDTCHCPTASTWSETLKCTSSAANSRLTKQIDADLRPFAGGISFSKVLNESVSRFASHPRTYAFCHYQILSNVLYRQCYGEYTGFSRFADEMLLSLARKATLPDTEFLLNLGDWPLSDQRPGHTPLPIFSWCGSEDSYDIVLPTYELTESILHAQGRITTDILSVFGSQAIPFTRKANRLFWRGRDSARARLKLIKLAQTSPELFNVSITNFFFFRDEMAEYTDNSTAKNSQNRPASPYIPFLDFFNSRYQLNLDGTVAAYRLPFLLSGSSLALKQDSPYYEFFYKLLQPGLHYLPVESDLNDLLPILFNLTDNEDSATSKRIIWRARAFTLSHLLPENVYCYYYNLIRKYSALLRDPVVLREDVQLVTLNESDSDTESQADSTPNCNCSVLQETDSTSIKEEL